MRSTGTGSFSSTFRLHCSLCAPLFLLPSGRGPATSARLDIAGAITITASLMLAVYAIVNGNQIGWTSGQTIGLACCRGSAARDLSLDRGSGEFTVMPLGLFRLRQCATANVIGVLWTAAMFCLVLPPRRSTFSSCSDTARSAGWARLPASHIDHGSFLARLSARFVVRSVSSCDCDGAAAGRVRDSRLRTDTSRRELPLSMCSQACSSSDSALRTSRFNPILLPL